jgi:predicted alpha/beta superfamily hydrolase
MLAALMKLLVVLCAACAGAPPQAARVEVKSEAKAVLGDVLTLESKILGERRVINVYVPPGYATASERYPVMYMADGGMNEDFPHVVGSVDVSIKNAVIRPVIVVGIQNTERRRDLVGATVVAEEQQAAPHAGGAERFRRFLRDEVTPLVEQRYRTTAERAIIGESLSGLFVVETLLVEPAMFDSYIAADPSVWWNEAQLLREAAAHLAGWTAGAKTLYVASSQDDIGHGSRELVAAIDRSGAPIAVTYEPMPAEHHGTIFPTAALHGIRLVFAPR